MKYENVINERLSELENSKNSIVDNCHKLNDKLTYDCDPYVLSEYDSFIKELQNIQDEINILNDIKGRSN